LVIRDLPYDAEGAAVTPPIQFLVRASTDWNCLRRRADMNPAGDPGDAATV